MEKNKVKVSIIVSIYNTEEYLRECIESILHQTFSDIELILINDGSTDGSLQIMEKYADLDDRIVIINQENHGQGYSRNRGVEKSTGEYILFLDSDDYFEPDTVEYLYKESQKYNTELFYYSGKVVNDIRDERYINYNPYKRNWKHEDVITGEKYFLEKYPNIIASSCMVLIRKDFLEKHSISFREKYYHEDVAYNFKLLINAKRVFGCDNEFYCRRFRPESVMTMRRTMKHALGQVYAAYDILNEIKECEDLYYQYSLEFLGQSINVFFETTPSEEEKKEYEDGVLFFLDKVSDRLHRIKNIEFIRGFIYQASRLVEKGLIKYDVITLFASVVDDYDRKKYVKLLLKDATKSVGVYGIGKRTEAMLKDYERLMGEIHSRLFFILTEPGEIRNYMNHEVISVDNISLKKPDQIIISSVLYGDQMENEIKKRFGEQYVVVRPL